MVNLIFLTKREAKNVLVNESHRAKQEASEISVKDLHWLTEITEGSWLSDDGSLTILMPLAFLEDSNLPRSFKPFVLFENLG